MVHSPKILFLDEPTTGLDPSSRSQLWAQIRLLRKLGTTVFLTTHYMEEADALCDRIAIIDHGRIVAEGTPDELKGGIHGDILSLTVNHVENAPEVALGAAPRAGDRARGDGGRRQPPACRVPRRRGASRRAAAAGRRGHRGRRHRPFPSVPR